MKMFFRYAVIGLAGVSMVVLTGCGGKTTSPQNGAANHPPTAENILTHTQKNRAVSIRLLGSDEDNQSIRFLTTHAPGHGTLSGTAPVLTYTPAHNFTGEDVFGYVTNDGEDNSTEANVTITVSDLGLIGFGDADHGMEPWVTDGTSAGTQRLVDLNDRDAIVRGAFQMVLFNGSLYFGGGHETSGWGLYRLTDTGRAERVKAMESIPRDLTVAGGKLYFVGSTHQDGEELWVSDGTESGTKMVRNIRPHEQNSNPSHLIAMDGKLYFSADNGVNGRELWVSDGTESGTVMVSDIYNGVFSSEPHELTVMNGKLYFVARDWANGSELREYDPATDTVSLVRDIASGNNGSDIGYLTIVNGNTLFFSAYDTTNGRELWKSDGTSVGTVLVTDIRAGNSSSSPRNITPMGSEVFFSADDGTDGRELWKSDGTTTSQVKNINTHGSEGSDPRGFTVVNGKVYFSADDGEKGRELWVSDGTGAGTNRVADIYAGTESSAPDSLHGVGHVLYFAATDADYGAEIYRYDTDAGGLPERITDIVPGRQPCDIGIVGVNGSEIYIVALKEAVNYAGSVVRLYHSSGVPNAQQPVAMLGGATENGFLDKAMVEMVQLPGGDYLFAADDGIHGTELYRSDTTVSGTKRVRDIVPGRGESLPQYLSVLGSKVVFVAQTPDEGYELWVSDGTEGGTQLLRDIAPGTSCGIINPYDFRDLHAVLGSMMFFAADDGTDGEELWKTDGTPDGTSMVKNISSGSSSSNPSFFAAMGSKVYFSAQRAAEGTELWVSDGTDDGTQLLKDIAAGPSSSDPRHLTRSGNAVFFSARDSAGGVELWKTDGTADGTGRVIDINPAGSSSPHKLTDANGTLFFVADNGTDGEELWVSDGSESGTRMVKDINPTPGADANIGTLKALGNKVLFSASDGTAGESQLWISDGTEAGTMQLHTFTGSFPGSGVQFAPFKMNGQVLFYVVYGDHSEIWITDGTPSGTRKLAEEQLVYNLYAI